MDQIDHLWIVICACFVFFMQAGFICYEVGFVRPKNVVSVAIENIIAFVVATLAFCLVGFSFMFGQTQGGLIGGSNWLLQNLKSDYDYIFVLYELMFAGTAVTIFAGSMSERTKLKALVIAAIVTGAVIYPIFGHWVWGGNYTSQSTFLGRLGFMDFAGATVVHSTSGWVALAGAIVLGPRKGRWDENGKPKRMGRSNIPFAALGTFILWFSWFGFNGGNLFAFSDKVGPILLNTNIAAATGVVGAAIVTRFLAREQSFMEAVFNGALGGLVAITASSDILTLWQAALVGLIAGGATVLGSLLLLKLKIDDAVNAIPIHGIGGACGAILCAVFAAPDKLMLPTRMGQILVQLLGVGVNFIWAFGLGFVMFKLIDKTIGLRVSDEEEEKGLNVVEFSDISTWLEHLKEEHYEQLTQDLYSTIQKQNIDLQWQRDLLVATQERERQKVARDLHDGVGQSLVALKINFGLLPLQPSGEELKKHTAKAIRMVDEAIAEIRNVIGNLEPSALKKEGLSVSIKSLCRKLEKISGIHFRCTISDAMPVWSETEELNIFRIVQECLTNIIKHSGATEVDINMLTLNENRFLISVIDNGRGFNLQTVDSGFGLTSIRERSAILNAKIAIDSAEGGGTRVILEVPYE
ncbi:MAG TPA: ammonium transporter [Candidatus Cryosericum sp.]|nr:ammonium transporter [Candidatus Cryosericum sp.]